MSTKESIISAVRSVTAMVMAAVEEMSFVAAPTRDRVRSASEPLPVNAEVSSPGVPTMMSSAEPPADARTAE